MDDEIDEPNVMYKISIGMRDGDHEYSDEIFFFGSKRNAELYANSYMVDYLGEDSEYDEFDECWYSDDQTVAAYLYGVWPYETITAMTVKGALTYRMEFDLS
jgi:hypothetical protein